jgi:aminoglycoside 2'-N-acetyltransferase I
VSVELEVVSETALLPEDGRTLAAWYGEQFWAERPPFTCRIFARSGDEIVGHLGIGTRVIAAGDQDVRVGGIGGVRTRESWRGKGIATLLLRRAEEAMRDDLSLPFGFMTCRPEIAPVYLRLGWREVAGPTVVGEGSEAKRYAGLSLILPLGDDAWPDGAIDLRGRSW